MAALTRVVIFDQSLYRPTGLVGVWVRKITLKFSTEAKKAAPKRTGRMAASIRGTTRNPGPKLVQGTIGVSAPYVMYVLKGTDGPIMSTRGWAMHSAGLSLSMGGKPVPGTRMAVGRNLYPPVTPMAAVSGQAANNFLERAWRATARNHRAIRGMAFPLDL